VSDYYRFKLSTSGGDTKSVRVTKPDLALGNAAIKAAADKIVGANVFVLKSGYLNGIKAADKVNVQRGVLF